MANIPEFGIKRENEERRDGGCAVVFDPKSKKFAVNKFENGLLGLISGGLDKGEDIESGILREVTEESGLYDFGHFEKVGEALTHYYNILRKVNRLAHATCLLVILKSVDTKTVYLEEHEKFSLCWADLNEILDNWNLHNENHDHDHWIYFMNKATTRIEELGYSTVSNLQQS